MKDIAVDVLQNWFNRVRDAEWNYKQRKSVEHSLNLVNVYKKFANFQSKNPELFANVPNYSEDDDELEIPEGAFEEELSEEDAKKMRDKVEALQKMKKKELGALLVEKLYKNEIVELLINLELGELSNK